MSANGVVTITNLRPEYAKELARIQRIAYETLADHELLKEEHFLAHCRIFPEGSFVAFVGDKVVGMGSGFFIDFDFKDHHHTFQEIIAGGYYTNHDPNGEWYYGADIAIHPDYRGMGIARMLYDARKNVVKQYNKKGIVAGGLIPTYAEYKHVMTPHEYVKKVITGEVFGKTLSVQLRNGFQVRGLLQNYIEDPACDNWATLLVWENPDYRPHK